MDTSIATPQRVPNADGLFPLTQNNISPPGTFALALVLGGTVSTGAYTAGALDYLLYALDQWYTEKLPDGSNQAWADARHKIMIEMMTGASGGAVCASLMSILANRKITPIVDPADPGNVANPLWKIWVEELDIEGFTALDDLDNASTIKSILNAAPLEAASKTVIDFATSTQDDYSRPYFANPIRLAITHGNLRGVPYRVDVNGWQGSPGSCFVEHNDFVRVAVPRDIDSPPTEWSGANGSAGQKRPDEFWVCQPIGQPKDDWITWPGLAEFALASAAFPIGLPTRTVNKPLRQYLYRPFLDWSPNPDANPPTAFAPQLKWIDPAWDQLTDDTTLPSNYEYISVDGGVFNNDPVYLARTWLSGIAGHNPRDPKLADRAIFLIDPLASKSDSDCAKDVAGDLFGSLGPLLKSAIGGARYLTADLALMADPKVFSRFQLVPLEKSRGKIGDAAVYGSSLQAFGGFTNREFRVHDFMLGRVNMQEYLRREFVLHKDNPLFKWSAADLARWAVDGNGNRQSNIASDDCFMPLIPDLSLQAATPMAAGLPLAAVPQPGPFDPTQVKEKLQDRLKAVIGKAEDLKLSLGYRLLGFLLNGAAAGALADMLMSMLTSQLKEMGVEIVSNADNGGPGEIVGP